MFTHSFIHSSIKVLSEIFSVFKEYELKPKPGEEKTSETPSPPHPRSFCSGGLIWAAHQNLRGGPHTHPGSGCDPGLSLSGGSRVQTRPTDPAPTESVQQTRLILPRDLQETAPSGHERTGPRQSVGPPCSQTAFLRSLEIQSVTFLKRVHRSQGIRTVV